MFVIDMPYVPLEEPVAFETKVIISQSGDPVQKHDYLLKQCAEVTMTDTLVEAFNGLEIPGMLARALEKIGHAYIDIDTAATMKVIVLENPNHGTLEEWQAENGYTGYDYRSELGFEGRDSALFSVEFEGKRYKVDLHIQVVKVVDESIPGCDDPKLIELNRSSIPLKDVDSTLFLDSVSIPIEVDVGKVELSYGIRTEAERRTYSRNLATVQINHKPHNKRMQSDQPTRYARDLAADAER